MKQFILIINGPMCSGKSTSVGVIMSQHSKIFKISPRDIQFLISDYTPERDRELVHDCLLMMANRMLQEGMSLILEGGSVTQETVNQRLEAMGKEYNITPVYINIEADLDILKDRFEKRKELRIARGEKFLVKDMAGFMERYNAYLAIKGDTLTLDSGVLSPEEIAEKIMSVV